MAPATGKSTTNDTNQQMQQPHAPKRPRGRPQKSNYRPQILQDESDESDHKPERPRKVQKKKTVQSDLEAPEDNNAADPGHRGIRPGASGGNIAASPSQYDLHPGGYNPGLQLQGRSLRPTNHLGGHPSFLHPQNGYPTASFGASGAPGGFHKNLHTLLLHCQGSNIPGSPYLGSYLQGLSAQALNRAGDNNQPASLPRAGQQEVPLTAPGAPGQFPKRPYNTGGHHTGGPSRDSPLPPPPAANVLPRARPNNGVRSSSSNILNPAAAVPRLNVPSPSLQANPGPAPGYLARPNIVVKTDEGMPGSASDVGIRSCLALPPGIFEPGAARVPGRGVPASSPAVGSQDRPAPPRFASDSRPTFPVEAGLYPQLVKTEATGGPRLAYILAQQSRPEVIRAAEAMQTARSAPPLPPIVRLRGQTLHIRNLDDVFQPWPRFQTNERMIPFKAEVKEKNAVIYNATCFLPDEYKLMVSTDPALLASHLFPNANAHELRLAVEVVIWSTNWNIFMKKAAREMPADLTCRTVLSKSIMRYEVERRDTLPANGLGRWTVGHISREGLRFDDLMGSISRILESLSALYEPAYLDVFKEDFCDYLESLATEQAVLVNGNIPTADEYSEFSKKSIPPILRLALLDACEPDRASRCGLYKDLLSQTHRIMRNTSDLYSVQEDMRMGNVLNSFILRFQQCDDIEAAADTVVDEIEQACQAFDNAAQRKLAAARQAGELEAADCIKKTEILRLMIAGHRMWCISNNRYDIAKYRQDDGSIRIPLR